MKNNKLCIANTCDNYGRYRSGHCPKHYQILKRYGDANTSVRRTERLGLSSHPLYRTWSNMKYRCESKNCKAYPNYGGRGITVCRRWQHSFNNFLQDMGERPEGMTLDRIDNNKGYSPDNCRWADDTTQALNKRVFAKSKSGVSGVMRRSNGKWRSGITISGKWTWLGTYEKKDEAIRIRKQYEKFYQQEKSI